MNRYIRRIRRKFAKRRSLRWSMVLRLLFGWFLPLLMMIFIVVFFVTANSSQQMEHTIMTSLDKSTQMMFMQLKNCETASKNASYMPVISKSYEGYLKDREENTFRSDVENFLNISISIMTTSERQSWLYWRNLQRDILRSITAVEELTGISTFFMKRQRISF